MKKTLGTLFITTAISVSVASADEAAIVKGGQIFDRYYSVTGAPEPEGNNPSYANEAGKYDGVNSWRCKECHGWDYIGKDGRYSKGSHYSGIKGTLDAKDKPAEEIIALLRGETHAYTEEMIPAADMDALIMFLQQGQFDMYQYIDMETKKAINVNAENGEKHYTKSCLMCHGAEGNLNLPEGETLGILSKDNPQEILHKTLFGHPPVPLMPAMYKETAGDIQTGADILMHMQTMP